MTSPWTRSSRRHPCALCGNDTEWCSVSPDKQVIKCRVVSDGSFRTGDDGGGEYHLHWADGKPTGARVLPSLSPSPPPVPVAPVAERHRVYTALLSILTLSVAHRHALIRRGLTPSDIDRAGYKTLPPVGDRAQVVKALRVALGGTIANDIPGLDYSRATNSDIKLLGPSGVLIPVRDHQGQIQALKVRCDDPSRGKYLWLSSTSAEGPSPGAPCHLAPHPEAPHFTVRVTEGPLKADVARALSSLSTIGIPGVTAYRAAMPLLRELKAHTVVLAWDADARKKTTHVNFVASSLESFALLLAAEGIAVEVETWPTDDQHAPKGIDDALLAQAAITVHRGQEAWRVIQDTVTAAGIRPKAETVARAGGALEAPPTSPTNPLDGLAVRTATDPGAPLVPGVPAAAARLKIDDAAGYARLISELKGAGAPMGLFNAAVRDAEKTIRRETAPKPAGRVFSRGDSVELGAALLEDLRDGAAESIVYDRGQFWRYDTPSGIYVVITGQEIYRVASTYAGCFAGVGEKVKPIRLSNNDVTAVAKAAAQFAAHPGFFDRARDGLAFANGFVTVTQAGDVLTLPLSPEHRATHALPVAYDSDRPCSRWVAMLEQVFRRTVDLTDAEADPGAATRDTQDCVKLLQEFAGASVLGFATSYATCLVLVGPGNDGKSKTLSVLRALFPGNAVCSVPPQNWSRGFLLAELSGKRLNVVSELPEREIQESQRFKAVVAGDPLTAERKYADPFDLLCGAGHLFACNALPATRDQTPGFWRRFAVIPCTRQFTGDEDIRDYDRLVIAEEIAGVAAWAIAGAARLRKQGRYTAPGSSTQAKADWQLDSDQVRQFVEDRCVPTTGGHATLEALYDDFAGWCKRTGHAGMPRNRLGNRLRALGYDGRTKAARLFKLALRPPPAGQQAHQNHVPPPEKTTGRFDDLDLPHGQEEDVLPFE